MSVYYLNYDIERLKEQRKGSYLVPEGFKKATRLELKWAYVAFLNLLIDQPSFNEKREAYLNVDKMTLAKPLSELMNKKVDEKKVDQYIGELETADLLDIIESHYYLKRII